MNTDSGNGNAGQTLPPADGSAQFAYRLRGGAIVHSTCREAYAKQNATPYNYPGIEAAVYPSYQMPSGRFQLCAHCQAPIWDAPNGAGELSGAKT